MSKILNTFLVFLFSLTIISCTSSDSGGGGSGSDTSSTGSDTDSSGTGTTTTSLLPAAQDKPGSHLEAPAKLSLIPLQVFRSHL